MRFPSKQKLGTSEKTFCSKLHHLLDTLMDKASVLIIFIAESDCARNYLQREVAIVVENFQNQLFVSVTHFNVIDIYCRCIIRVRIGW